MKKLIILALLLTLQFSAFSQDGNFSHPWKGATVAFFGDSITDPGSVKENHDWTGFSDTHFWGYLQEWLGIKPLVYGVSGRKWDDVPNQANQLKSEHGDGFDFTRSTTS